jgi:hypothetical protein
MEQRLEMVGPWGLARPEFSKETPEGVDGEEREW